MSEQNKLEVAEHLKGQAEFDLAFLKDLKVHTVNGKKFLGDGQLPINVSKIFEEKDFVSEWLIQFALGNSFGNNYFNFNKWGKFTNLGTLCAMVVNENNEPSLIIPPLTTSNLTTRDLDLLRAASYYINGQQYNSAGAGSTQITVNKIEQHLESKRLTLTELIPDFYYERFEMYPSVEQTMFYIRDILLRGSINKEEFDALRKILVKEHKEEDLLSKEEREFVLGITLGKYNFKEYEPKTKDPKITQSVTAEEPFDPLAC